MSIPPQINFRILHGGPQIPKDEFEALWREIEEYYGVRLRRLLARLSFDRDEMNDLVQKTWVRAFSARRQYAGAGSFESWLMQIARTTYRNHVEAETVLRRKHSAAAENLIQDSPDLEALIYRVFESQQVLASVGPMDRRYLEFYSQGISHREIARRLKLVSEHAAKQRFSRLCRRLREQFS